MSIIDLEPYKGRIRDLDPMRPYGKVVDVVGLTLRATGPRMTVGDLCHIRRDNGSRIPVEVVGFRGRHILLMPLGDMRGIAPGNLLIPTNRPRMLRVGADFLGRVVDAMGQPIDGKPAPLWEDEVPLLNDPPPPMSRRRILEPIATGIRAIDGCVTCGRGQRMGVFSGSGVGKSKLVGMIARNTSADVTVIALVGERGREVREFIESDLGEDGLARAVVVVATSDEPALRRISAAYAATAVAEWFRAQGADVMLVMDSVTRFAMAQREVGLAIGEPPTTKGYPPSVFSLLPKLLERAGMSEKGSITGFYAVLIEGDDIQDPVGDAVRSILDGHVSLSRDLAGRGHYPPVDVLDSVSRSMNEVTSDTHRELAIRMRQLLAAYRDTEDLINIGAYVAGSNAEVDTVLRLKPSIDAFLRQGLWERSDFGEIEARMTRALRG